MPAPITARPLNFWEQISSMMGVTMGFELEGKVDADMVKAAFEHTQKEYPYLRMVLKQDNNQLCFVDHPSPLDLKVVTAEPLPDFRKAMIKTANTLRDHSKSVIYMDLYSVGEKHILLSTLNHAGMDALNGFQIYISFFTALGHLSSGKHLHVPKENIFADVLSRVPADLRKSPALKVPEKYMAQISPVPSAKSGDAVQTDAIFRELPTDVTAALLKKCHAKGCTVQGAVSAANAIANAAVRGKEFPLPQTLLLQCPASVRDQVVPPVTPADGGQGASLLWWPQDLAPKQALWAAAKDASAAVKRESEAKGGLAFWARLHAHMTMAQAYSQDPPPSNPTFTTTASSIGVNPLAAAYGPLKLHRAHIMLATYGVVSPTEAGHMTHAHTFNNKLCMTFTYSMPAFGAERAKLLAATQEAVLKALASGEEGAAVDKFMAVDTTSLSLELMSLWAAPWQ